MKPLDRLSFQLYSARELQPLDEQFRLLALLGYRMVEPFGGLYADPAKLRSLMDRHAMSAPTAHVGFDRLRADTKAAVALCKSLGVKTMLAPAPLMGEREGGEDHWRKLGRELAGYHRIVTGEGLDFGWHNHHWEYGRTASGTTFLDCIFEEAPGLKWEADLAWIMRGGGDPVAELAKHRDRVFACHVKDLAPAGQNADEDGWADPGHGVMDWTKLLAAMKDAGVDLFIVEHDKPSDIARFARRARDTVAAWA